MIWISLPSLTSFSWQFVFRLADLYHRNGCVCACAHVHMRRRERGLREGREKGPREEKKRGTKELTSGKAFPSHSTDMSLFLRVFLILCAICRLQQCHWWLCILFSWNSSGDDTNSVTDSLLMVMFLHFHVKGFANCSWRCINSSVSQTKIHRFFYQ